MHWEVTRLTSNRLNPFHSSYTHNALASSSFLTATKLPLKTKLKTGESSGYCLTDRMSSLLSPAEFDDDSSHMRLLTQDGRRTHTRHCGRSRCLLRRVSLLPSRRANRLLGASLAGLASSFTGENSIACVFGISSKGHTRTTALPFMLDWISLNIFPCEERAELMLRVSAARRSASRIA